MNWLFKEEPTHYGWEDFVRDGKIVLWYQTDAFLLGSSLGGELA